MKKRLILMMAVLAGFLTVFSISSPALAKTRSARIVSSRKLSKTPYHAVSGYLYTSAHLTKKAHNADNYPRTTFYAYHSDTVRKANGNKAVYYYVKNGNGKVKGWIWRGHLVRVISLQKQLSQFNELIGLIDSTTTKTHDRIVSLLKTVNSDTTISDLISDLNKLKSTLTNSSDITKLNQIISLFQSDFNTGISNLNNLAQALHVVNTNLNNFISNILNQLTTTA
ncbi:D-alanyl-D-alanine carboxypeptidase [Secundilactobacillus folii]|uniref:D-alanyl-D-alanine carboxypeptidase n=1 Tax=Secundilactobacillus folii TaxID=2678357 RepID=A0A7X2XVZ7_9LACO|nr:D-alanyl-D-alanine carboxypeptidase [Secundilactobacillus folii]MTV82702.1 D-alanyl-D-alanine carboxypeptidase [Secundilactobacillus folii]